RNSIAMKSAAGPFGHMSMGGLVTVLKVRDSLQSYDTDPGWYKHPPGTVALKASDDELRRDGIDASKLTPNGGDPSKAAPKQNGHQGH
ncbi:MAG TPA: hypothetical protein VE616_24125, partial [Candidatus Udaeobacter sp.]|nr:hypothetical protein [Candidatus Udaeobacter sp.]